VSPPDRSWTTAGLDEAAYEALAAGLPASEVWSLLMGVLARRARQRSPADLLQQWERDRFLQISYIDQRTLIELDGHLLAAAAGFEAVELSPLAPLGACSVLGLASQNKTVSALRGTEVVSDPTNVLALECARRERRDHAFLVDALVEQIATHLAAFERLERHGYRLFDLRVKVLSTQARIPLAERVAGAITNASVSRETFDHPYYDGLRFMINARTAAGDDVFLSDGGAFDWLRKVMSNRRITFVASGMGMQLVAYRFRA
jgi:hypothetical protein